MGIYYSASTGGFYHTDIHKDIPPDAMEIAPEEHAALLDAQSAGREISASPDGRPKAAARLESAEEKEMRIIAAARAALTASDMAVLRCYEDGIMVPDKLKAYRTELRGIISGKRMTETIPQAPKYEQES